LDTHLNLDIKHRGSPAIGREFKELHRWGERHWEDLLFLLGERYVLFGEWMFNKHTIFYDKLPHFFLESDIYDQERQIWLSTSARNNLLKGHEYIKQVPVIAAIKPKSMSEITSLVGKTQFQSEKWQEALKNKCSLFGANPERAFKETDQSGLMEGLYIKHEDDLQVFNRYKYIRYEFLESILNSGTHLVDRLPIYNSLMGEGNNFQVGE